MGISDIDTEQFEKAKEAYNKGYKDGQEALAYHIELCKEEAEPCEDCISRKAVLDKIKAEIIDTGAYEQEVNGKTEFLKGINYCLGVIDKYKAESEDR